MLPTSNKQATRNMLLRGNKQGEKVGKQSKQSREKPRKMGVFHGKKVSKNETLQGLQIKPFYQRTFSPFSDKEEETFSSWVTLGDYFLSAVRLSNLRLNRIP